MRKKKRDIILEKVKVEDYAAEGKSIARVDGKVVFIERVVPGDVVDVRLTRNRKDCAEGYPLQFHTYSAERTEPFCSHFGVCGGCQWQMLPYEKQLEYKRQQVEDNLRRIGKLELPSVPPVTGADETRYYRNKLEYTFSSKRYFPDPTEIVMEKDAEHGGVAGFHARRFFDKVVEIEHCHLQEKPSNSIRNTIVAFAREHGYSFYDYKQHTGFLRTLQVRIATTGEVMVNLVMGEEDAEKRSKLIDHLLQEVSGITTLLYTVNTKRNDSLNDLSPVVVTGRGYIIEKLGNFQFKIGPKSFFQTNTKQAEKLYSITRDFTELTGSEILYDLYCGTGSIGIFCSRQAAKVIGVDQVPEAIEDAKENAAANNILHAAFFSGDVIRICNDEFFTFHGQPDVLITDPPRVGMHEKLVRKILDTAAPIVVYVSCNPATQARDLALLNEKYAVNKIQPVDMFPHTLHIENVVQLKLREHKPVF